LNRADARAKHTIHGFIGEYRLAWRSGYQPVLLEDDKGRKIGPQYFQTEQEAELAAWRHKNEQDQPIMTCSGHKISPARSEAEKLFRRNA